MMVAIAVRREVNHRTVYGSVNFRESEQQPQKFRSRVGELRNRTRRQQFGSSRHVAAVGVNGHFSKVEGHRDEIRYAAHDPKQAE